MPVWVPVPPLWSCQAFTSWPAVSAQLPGSPPPLVTLAYSFGNFGELVQRQDAPGLAVSGARTPSLHAPWLVQPRLLLTLLMAGVGKLGAASYCPGSFTPRKDSHEASLGSFPFPDSGMGARFLLLLLVFILFLRFFFFRIVFIDRKIEVRYKDFS